jgi:type I restriction enzyme M protein
MKESPSKDKSLESWIWDAACSIRGAKDAPKYKDYILPLVFAKRLCDVFDDELNRIAKEVGSRAKAFRLVKHDKKLVRFFLPLEPKNPEDAVWSIIRTLSNKIGEQLTWKAIWYPLFFSCHRISSITRYDKSGILTRQALSDS